MLNKTTENFPQSRCSWRYDVIASCDPSAIARVCELFTIHNNLPEWMTVRTEADEFVSIQLAICGLTARQAAVIAEKLRVAVVVMEVRHWPADASLKAPAATAPADAWRGNLVAVSNS